MKELKLTLFLTMFPFDSISEKKQENFGFPMFSGGSNVNVGKKRAELGGKNILTYFSPLLRFI